MGDNTNKDNDKSSSKKRSAVVASDGDDDNVVDYLTTTNTIKNDDADDDDDNDKKETTTQGRRPAKRRLNRAAATTAISNDDEVAVATTAVPPVRPRLDPFAAADNNNTKTRPCVIYICCDEGSSSSDNNNLFLEGLEKCKQNCSADVHKHCFQMDGTRHMTMWSGNLSNQQVAAIQQKVLCEGMASKQLPLLTMIDFETGFNSWKAGNYIGLSAASITTLKDILSSIIMMESSSEQHSDESNSIPDSGKISCDHLSLYRKRGMWSAASQLKRVRTALANFKWGSLKGISIRVKELGGPYDECKVLMAEAYA